MKIKFKNNDFTLNYLNVLDANLCNSLGNTINSEDDKLLFDISNILYENLI